MALLFSFLSAFSHFPDFLKLCLFVYFWLRRVFVAVCGLSLVAVSGGYSPPAVSGLLISVVFLVAAHRLQVDGLQ